MKKLAFVFMVVVTILSASSFATDTDERQFVKMPPEAIATLRAEMLKNQVALHLIIGALAENKFAEAGDIAEKEMGISTMGKHRKLEGNARPGRFMPDEMHAIGRSSHVAASDFAKLAKSAGPDDLPKLLTSLQNVTRACIACHQSYRTR